MYKRVHNEIIQSIKLYKIKFPTLNFVMILHILPHSYNSSHSVVMVLVNVVPCSLDQGEVYDKHPIYLVGLSESVEC